MIGGWRAGRTPAFTVGVLLRVGSHVDGIVEWLANEGPLDLRMVGIHEVPEAAARGCPDVGNRLNRSLPVSKSKLLAMKAKISSGLHGSQKIAQAIGELPQAPAESDDPTGNPSTGWIAVKGRQDGILGQKGSSHHPCTDDACGKAEDDASNAPSPDDFGTLEYELVHHVSGVLHRMAISGQKLHDLRRWLSPDDPGSGFSFDRGHFKRASWVGSPLSGASHGLGAERLNDSVSRGLSIAGFSMDQQPFKNACDPWCDKEYRTHGADPLGAGQWT